MGKSNGATSTKPKAKDSSRGKPAAKVEKKTDKKLDKKPDNKKVEVKDTKKVEAKKVEPKKVEAKKVVKEVAAVKKDVKAVKEVKEAKAEKTSSSGSTRTVAAPAPRPSAPTVTYKCPYPPDELVKWRQILMAKRHEVTDDIAGLVKDAMDAEDGHTTPNHIAERGSDADLQDLSLGVAGEEKDVVWQIDRALRKIDANRPIPFGLCEHTKEPIAKTRLQLIPWTPLSIEGATYMEKNSLMLEDLLIED